MSVVEQLNKNIIRKKRKKMVESMSNKTLMYTIFLPLVIYYKLEQKYGNGIREKRYKFIIKNEDIYKQKVLNEMIKYIVHDFDPKYKSYLIYRTSDDEYSIDLVVDNFISYRDKKYNRVARRYYNAKRYFGYNIDYKGFMDELGKYFKQDNSLQVNRGVNNSYGMIYDYLELKIIDK